MIRPIVIASLVIIVLVIWLIWVGRSYAPVVNEDLKRIVLRSPQGKEVHLQMEIADDDAERSLGLMYRDTMPEGEGMLFMFQQEQPLSFWMKNTLIPLDILFFDAKGGFVSRTTMDPCSADPCVSYPSAGPAQYALEVLAGEHAVSEVTDGWKLER